MCVFSFRHDNRIDLCIPRLWKLNWICLAELHYAHNYRITMLKYDIAIGKTVKQFSHWGKKNNLTTRQCLESTCI